MEQYIPYSLICNLFSRNLDSYNSYISTQIGRETPARNYLAVSWCAKGSFTFDPFFILFDSFNFYRKNTFIYYIYIYSALD